MNGSTTGSAGRSVQLAVLATPSASVAQAVAEARRRVDASPWAASADAGRVRRLVPASA
jgi:hypothetical protein